MPDPTAIPDADGRDSAAAHVPAAPGSAPSPAGTWSDRGLTPRLRGTRFAEVRWFAEIDSTNRYLLDEAAASAPEGLVAVADVQTAGRGRLGRRWEAPSGASLLASALLRPDLPAERLHLVTVAAGVAAARAVADLAGIRAGLKWPNDLVIGGRKLAGLLAETPGGRALVVGMGLNVKWAAFPPSSPRRRRRATSSPRWRRREPTSSSRG
ncbi:MAG: biotin--[acetyl-CoA-carboxylase] ligase [Acidimicrobiia bacterium]|nr:biotin--[acetyl-CoA-carboxylase] ligase [Acidimicrobiia bacterium]